MKEEPKYPQARQQECERMAGRRYVGGRIHGSLWKPVYEVIVSFETEKESDDFFISLYEDGTVSAE